MPQSSRQHQRRAVFKTAAVVFLLYSAGLAAHPFDESYAVSKSLFVVGEEKVEFKVNFYINSYIKLHVGNAKEYDVFEKKLIAERNSGSGPEYTKMKAYILSKVRAFLDKQKLNGHITELQLDFDTLEMRKDRLRTVRVSGHYDWPADMKKAGLIEGKLYIFNQLFDSASVVHMGMGEIEYDDQIIDFMFSAKNYFVIPIKFD